MRKQTHFGRLDPDRWPDPSELEPYFLAPKGKEWLYSGGNDQWGLHARGLYETEHLTPQTGRVDVHLFMVGHPEHGVSFAYAKWDGRTKRKYEYSSKGDLRRLREYVYTMQGTPRSIGLFIPFADAWRAVKEFIETDGELPKSIEWIADGDLPPEAFPRP
jgi:immunity protein Imm1 of predicted polymorphic toxin system